MQMGLFYLKDHIKVPTLRQCKKMMMWMKRRSTGVNRMTVHQLQEDLYTYEMGKLLVSFIIQMPDCQGFLHQIDSAIESLGGKVFPKLNWSAPQDARWVSFNNSLMCTHASDVCLLLKSSDFITHDLTQSFLQCEDYEATSAEEHLKPELILRRWTDINTSDEFRCFVHRGNLVAISQRNHSKYFRHIVTSKNEIQTDIQNFFEEVIDGNFAAEESSYVFDIWRTGKGRILLIDFNPCGPVTDPLLFDWQEIEAMDSTHIERGLIFRCIETETGIHPNIHTPFGVPQDFIDLAAGEDPFKLKDLLQLGNTEQDSSSDDDDDDKNKDAVQALEIESHHKSSQLPT
ncbi:cell division cycle protein 123 homolog isoform X2 [Pomacea canaliculata]|uniref:cell division cycle protein 123 homolog isoform X2 n=1 Tax=Pomacea canaliculata TaxID=400727 RepID=UPI000D735E25|nr:cell division cycle protein 123 homolog isoform X2 [Pomacea canaliculata]